MDLLTPESADDVVEVVKAALANETPLAIAGNRTRDGLGRPVAASHGVSCRALTGIQSGHRFFATVHDMGPESPPFGLQLNGAKVAASSLSKDTFTVADGALEDYLNGKIIYCV